MKCHLLFISSFTPTVVLSSVLCRAGLLQSDISILPELFVFVLPNSMHRQLLLHSSFRYRMYLLDCEYYYELPLTAICSLRKSTCYQLLFLTSCCDCLISAICFERAFYTLIIDFLTTFVSIVYSKF